jgi:hypothetical protein
MMTSMFSCALATTSFAATSAQSSLLDPEWARRTTMSASSLVSSPSVNWSATRLAATASSPKVTSSIPDGVTRLAVSSVTVPTMA